MFHEFFFSKKQEKAFWKLGTGGSTTKGNPQIFTNEIPHDCTSQPNSMDA